MDQARDGGRAARLSTATMVSLYAMLIPFQPILTTPDGSSLRIAAADLVAPVAFLFAVSRPTRRLAFGITALALAIPVLALFSTLWAATGRTLSGYALGKTAGLFYLVAFSLAAGRGLERGTEPMVLRAFALGALWSAAAGLVAFVAFQMGFPTPLMNGDRLCSMMPGDPNIYGSVVAMGLLITVAERRLSARARIVRAAILAAALIATGSRSAALAAVTGLLVYGLVQSRDRWVTVTRGAYATAVCATAAAALLFTTPGWNGAQRLSDHVWRAFTIDSRLELYERALEQFVDNPLTGVGVGGFHDLNVWSVKAGMHHFAVHNTYLWALVDMGIGGGLLLVSFIVATMWRCLDAVRRESAESAAVLAATLAGMIVFNLFIDGFYQRHLWLLIACTLAMPLQRRMRQVPAGAHPQHPAVAYASAR